MKHHPKKPPSSLPAKNLCIHYESGGGSAASNRGTDLHHLFELGIKRDPSLEANIEKYFKAETITEEDLKNLVWAEEELFAIFCEIVPPGERTGINCLSDAFEKGLAFSEADVRVYDDYFEEITFGSLDFFAYNILCDLKTGEIRNYREQMEAYSLGKFQECPELEKIVVVELYSSKKRTVIYTLTPEKCEKSIFALSKRIDEGTEPPRSNEYCKWCKKRTSCSQTVGAVTVLQERRDDFPKDFNFQASKLRDETIGALMQFREFPDDPQSSEILQRNVQNFRELYELGEAASSFFSGVKACLTTVLKEGISIPGLELKPRKGTYTSDNQNELYNFLAEEVTPNDFIECTKVSISSLSKKFALPEDIEKLYLNEEIQIPKYCFGKPTKDTPSGKLLKSKCKPAFENLLEKKGLIQRGTTSFSLIKSKKDSLKENERSLKLGSNV